jgi:hypothetical protein
VSEAESLKEAPFVNERTADNGEHSHWELLDSDGEILWTEDTENCFKDTHHPSYKSRLTGQQGESEVQICYKSNQPCKHNCSGLCKESV